MPIESTRMPESIFKALQETYTTEKTFNENMHHFVKQLKSVVAPKLSKQEKIKLDAYLEKLEALTASMTPLLSPADEAKALASPPDTRILREWTRELAQNKSFSNHLAEIAVSYEADSKFFNKFREAHPEFDWTAIIVNPANKNNKTTIDNFAIMPVQRAPRYRMLGEAIAGNASKAHFEEISGEGKILQAFGHQIAKKIHATIDGMTKAPIIKEDMLNYLSDYAKHHRISLGGTHEKKILADLATKIDRIDGRENPYKQTLQVLYQVRSTLTPAPKKTGMLKFFSANPNIGVASAINNLEARLKDDFMKQATPDKRAELAQEWSKLVEEAKNPTATFTSTRPGQQA